MIVARRPSRKRVPHQSALRSCGTSPNPDDLGGAETGRWIPRVAEGDGADMARLARAPRRASRRSWISTRQPRRGDTAVRSDEGYRDVVGDFGHLSRTSPCDRARRRTGRASSRQKPKPRCPRSERWAVSVCWLRMGASSGVVTMIQTDTPLMKYPHCGAWPMAASLPKPTSAEQEPRLRCSNRHHQKGARLRRPAARLPQHQLRDFNAT